MNVREYAGHLWHETTLIADIAHEVWDGHCSGCLCKLAGRGTCPFEDQTVMLVDVRHGRRSPPLSLPHPRGGRRLSR